MATKTTKTTKTRTPTHLVYQVREREDDKAIWTRIGACWPHSDGKGFSMELTATPLNGRLSIRAYEPQPQAGR